MILAMLLVSQAAVNSSHPNSKEDVSGICNQHSEKVKLHNTESPGNDCEASPMGGQCESSGKRAFIPKCESSKDFPGHHFELTDDNGFVYSITTVSYTHLTLPTILLV